MMIELNCVYKKDVTETERSANYFRLFNVKKWDVRALNFTLVR